MWSDTLLAAERGHLIRIVLWAATSAALGTALLAFITLRRMNAPVVFWFTIQTLAWGSLELMVVAGRWQALAMRDVSGATRLDRLTWFTIGLDIGLVGVGVSTAVMAWRRRRSLGAVGGGLVGLVQGVGLLVLDLTFASSLARLI